MSKKIDDPIVKSIVNDSTVQMAQEWVNSTIVKTAREITAEKVNKSKHEINDIEVEFSVFCVENVANELDVSGQEVYELLAKKSNILDEYIIPNYEILHTQSKEYIVNDIIEYMKECGVIK